MCEHPDHYKGGEPPVWPHAVMRRWEGRRGAGWRGGGWGVGRSNDTLTFEPETNESIVIKLFICLFTMKNGEGRGGGLGRHHEGEEKGRTAACTGALQYGATSAAATFTHFPPIIPHVS